MSYTGTEQESLITSRADEAPFCNFLRNIVAPATQKAIANAISALPQTLLYPHRLALDQERCQKIETSLYNISRYIHAGTSGADIENNYAKLYEAVNETTDISSQKQEYQHYAIRMMKRYGVTDKFAKMVMPAENEPLIDSQVNNAATPSFNQDQLALQKNLYSLFLELRELDTEVKQWTSAAEKRNMQVLQTDCQKIMRIIFKIFYFLFTIFGSGSGFLGGTAVPQILSGHDDAPDAVKYLCGFLGYLCWVFLFLSYRDSVKMISFTCRSVFIIIFSAFTALPSAFFAGSNMTKIINSFLKSAPETLKTIMPYAAQFSSFSSNLALNLAVTNLLLAIPKQIYKFTQGVRRPGEVGLTITSLMVSTGVGLSGIVPYISFKNLIPYVNLPGIVNLLLCVFGDLPSAMLGVVCLLNGAEPWGVFTNPQYRWAGRLSGLVLGVIAPIVFFGFNKDSIVKEDGELHALNHQVLYWFIQMLAGLGNLMAYGKLGLYIQDMFGEQKIPPLFPAIQGASDNSTA
ncbi:MAG: hypothetical protein EXR81_01635 [Gammaproteobacteria bacterium]|nr:hypothetical protein [Gammaproteobacteria bacterium]